MANNNDFWQSFGDSSAYQEVEDGFTGSLASDVVEAYGLRCKTSSIGGSLSSLDIKHMDALQLIKISLLQDSIQNNHGPYEAYVDYADGSVEFREVGSYSAGVSDIYFETQTSTYVERCSGVLITGKKPLIKRLEKLWISILDNAEIYDMTAMVSNCNKTGFSATAYIIYEDPNLTTNYNDGIDNLYEITDPFESIVGYGKMINSPELIERNNINVTHSRQASVPILVPEAIQTLIRRPAVPTEEESLDSSCWAVYSEEVEGGVEIPIDSKFRYTTNYGTIQDNFIQISKVFVIGIELSQCGSKPVSDASMERAMKGIDTEVDHEVWVRIDDTQKKAIMLKEDIDYVINYSDGENPMIQFANNSRTYDKAKYGADTIYKVNPQCSYANGRTMLTEKGTILPQGDSGILVEEVWVMADLDTPSIIINDPEGQAYDIAVNFEYYLMPIILYDEPPPIGFNGRLIDQRDQIADKDPRTRQNFSQTEMEQVMNQLDGGGGFSLTLSFLEKEEVIALSSMLYKYMNGGNGIETVYTCGPDCNPKLGGYHSSGGVINKISYSYTDSGAYTVSVNESSRLILDTDLVGISGGPYFKKSESPSVKGTVIADLGNHIHYRVRVDGFGEKIAINCQSDVLRVGDKITCTIHNNPVEQ